MTSVPAKPNSSSLVSALRDLASELEGELFDEEMMRTLYATDASAYQETPLAVAWPQSESDLRKLIHFARQWQVGLIPRTAGTSLAGQVVGSGIVVDVSRYWTRIIEIDPEQQWVRVQPGVIRDELNLALAEHGLMFGPETSTANRAMIGGMVGNNSCGSNSVVYGSTRDHTLEITGLLSDGSAATFRALSAEALEQICRRTDGGLESQIYRDVRKLLSDPSVRDRIRQEFPKPEIKRRNTGYAIDLLMDAQVLDAASSMPFDFCKLLAGSEGTLFFTTEIKLNCVPLPPPVSGLMCAHFETVDQALRATLLAVQKSPFAVELIDRFIIEGALRNREQRKNADFIQGQPGAILVTEIRGQTEAEVREVTDQLESEMRQQRLGYCFPVLFGRPSQAVWQLRKAGLGVVANLPGDEKPVAVIEDTAVAVADLPEYIRQFNQILESEFGLQCVHYAHAGSGEIHLRPIINLKTRQGNDQFRQVATRIAELVKSFRGSLSGEHGDGRLRGEFLESMVGPENYQVIRRIKQIWDPEGIFNPGKIVDTPPMNSGLRYQPGQPTRDLPTVFDFSAEQGMQRAAELCSGSGDCRKTHLAGGTMCPSYMATRQEQDSTRARANLLRQVLTRAGDDERPLDNESLKRVMDLCLSCKGCKRECPSNVDVGKLKAEFLQAYYDANGVPRRTRLIAGYADKMKLAARMPRLFNWLVTGRWTSRTVKWVSGFHPQRSLPRLHRTTLRNWFASRPRDPAAGQQGRVLLFCDEFTNYNDTPIGIAAVELLERLGVAVDLPEHVESGRAALSKGLLRQAREYAETNVRQLAPLVSRDCPLVGIEPSAVLSFRDEYPVLVRPELRYQARQLAEHVLLFDEYIERMMDESRISSDQFLGEDRTIRLHGHCHQKALASLKPTVRMLQLPTGYRVRLIPSGCCGMAGSFGYETEHFDLSMQIGELVLFPTVRAEPASSIIAAAGTSCRHQLADGTGVTALHPVEILHRALKPKSTAAATGGVATD